MALKPALWQPAAARIIPLLIVTIALISITGRASYIAQPGATSTAQATGSLSVMWGDPYRPAAGAQGAGSETLSVQGPVIASNLPGYYTYKDPSIWGTFNAQWNTSNATYSVDATFYQSDSPYNRTTIFPAANTFAVSYMYVDAKITINGIVTHQEDGLAALLADAPGFFSYHGTARATMIVLYSPSHHADQYFFRWSQTSQVIDGIQQPAAATLTQTVQLT